MKVCLIGYYDEGQYGLRCVESTLDEAGHEVDLIVIKGYFSMFKPPTEKEYELLENLVREINPDLIGITVRSPFVWLAKDITLKLKEIAPILWGGFHTTVAPEYAIKRPDMILRGEADRTFPMLADKLSNGGDLSEVPGLWWKEGDEVHKNPLGAPIEDLDSLPYPLLRNEHRWFIGNDCLVPGDPLLMNELNHYYPAMASRGCPQKCTYCANAALMRIFGREARLIRLRDPDRVIEEVRRFRDAYGDLKIVSFMDEIFGYKSKWVEIFCEKWKKEIGCNFHAEIHPSLVKEELILKMKDAGLKYLNMGVQSGSERVRREVYDRPVSNEKILKAADILHRNGIGYRVEFISGNPLEEADDLKESLDLVLKLPRPYVSVNYQLTCFPGTPLTERFLRDGIITIDQVQGYSEDVTKTWDLKIDLCDGHSNDYYFYLCLLVIAEFRRYWGETWDSVPKPHFYPPWFIRFLEKRSWLRKNPQRMLALTDKLGKFAHWWFYWFTYFPGRLITKLANAFRMAVAGDVKGLKDGLKNLNRRIAYQLGISQQPAPPGKAGCPQSGE